MNLEHVITVNTIGIGVPPFGSTKTVEIQFSMDGEKYQTVAKKVFLKGIKKRAYLSIDNIKAHYVRIAYIDKYNEKIGGYNSNYMFTNELEVYGYGL